MIRVNGVQVSPTNFPDKTFCLKFYCPARVGGMYTIDWRWEDPSEYMLLYLIVNHLRDKLHIKSIELIMPYIPDARMDRTKEVKEVFTLKYFAKFINSMNFDAVGVLDPHSNVSASLFDRVYQIDVGDFIADAYFASKSTVVCFPDKGAMDRYNKNECPFLYGDKDRKWDTGEIKGLIIHNPQNLSKEFLQDAHVLIIDDICSKGGTFYYAGKALKELGVGQIDLYVTHCEPTIFDGKLLTNESPISHIYTTDSLVRPHHDNITEMKIMED